MSTSTIMTADRRAAVHTWRAAFANRWALQDPSFTAVAEIGSREWRAFWGDLYEQDLPKAGLRNPLRSAWYTDLMTRATAADLDALDRIFKEPCEGDEDARYGKAFYQFLVNELVRATYGRFKEGRPSSPAMASWCRAKGWGLPEDWTSPVVAPEPVAAAAASDPIATARAAMIAAGIPPAAIEIALAAAAAEKAAYEAAAAAAEAECAAANAEILARAAAPPPSPAEKQLAEFQAAIAEMEAIGDRTERAEQMCRLLHLWGSQAKIPALARNPAQRAALEAFRRRCAGDVYFSHCYLSVAEDAEDTLWAATQHPEFVA